MTGPLTSPLAVVAAWDPPRLRAAVAGLGLVADRLQPWRTRLDALGRGLAGAEVWSGPAGTAAATALSEVSGAAWSVHRAVTGSLAQLQELLPDAVEAQQLAAAATARAAAAGLALDPAGRVAGDQPLPAPAMAADQTAAVDDLRAAGLAAEATAAEALAAAERVTAAAGRAGEPLAGLGDVAGGGPVSFADLVVRLGTGRPRDAAELPLYERDPGRVAAWWAGLSPAQQMSVVREQPLLVGGLDGLPAWARDRANRSRLALSLRDWQPDPAVHRVVVDTAAALEPGPDGEVRQLLQFDPRGGLVSLSIGDLDTAGAVAVLVPGIRTDSGDLPGLTGDAADVRAAAAAAAPGLAVAGLVWLGYRTPGLLTAPSERAAGRAGPVLDRALDGLAAARAVPGAAPPPRTTVLAHSYGTLVTRRAAGAPGRLAADAVVLLGSPGVEAWTARALEAGEVYGAWSRADPVALSGAFGSGPTDPWFGDVALPTSAGQGHSQYYDRDRPTLAAIGEVVAGTRRPG